MLQCISFRIPTFIMYKAYEGSLRIYMIMMTYLNIKLNKYI